MLVKSDFFHLVMKKCHCLFSTILQNSLDLKNIPQSVIQKLQKTMDSSA